MEKLLQKFSRACLPFTLLASMLSLGACGSSGQPFVMDVTATMIVGDAGPSLINPVQQIVTGNLTAEVTDELHDRFELEITDFQVNSNFAGVGDINMVLDPNFTSTATVFKLNRNNNPFGTNTMDLSLIVETPDQNLTLSHLSLSSNNATLELAQDLPPLNFFVGGQPKEFDLSALAIQIPVQLIVSTGDPQ
ncbi:MAG: hypothetical protein U1F66_09195 [bacterium]